jgi:hypothetical protein
LIDHRRHSWRHPARRSAGETAPPHSHYPDAVADTPDENLNRKGRALSIATRAAAAGSGVLLAELLGPGGGAAAAQALAELGDTLVGKLIDWEYEPSTRAASTCLSVRSVLASVALRNIRQNVNQREGSRAAVGVGSLWVRSLCCLTIFWRGGSRFGS